MEGKGRGSGEEEKLNIVKNEVGRGGKFETERIGEKEKEKYKIPPSNSPFP